MPPFDCMMYFCRVVTPALVQPAVEIGDVARQDRLQIGVDDRRATAGSIRGSAARSRDDSETLQPGISSRDDVAHARLVLADAGTRTAGTPRATSMPLALQVAQRCAQRRPRRAARSTSPRKSTRSRTSPVRLGGTSGAGLSYMMSKIAGAVRPRLLGHFVDAAKSLGDQQPGPHALAFEQRVGADRGAVAEETRCRPAADARARAAASTPAQDGARRIVRRRRQPW